MELPKSVLSRFAAIAAAVALLTAVVLPALPARAASGSALAKSFATGFVQGFEKSTGVKLPKDEATCVGNRFVPKVKIAELAKIKTIDDLKPAQRQALIDSLGLCLSPQTYTAVLDKKLGTASVKQKICFEKAIITKLGVPKLLAVDFADFLKQPASAAVNKQISDLAASCA